MGIDRCLRRLSRLKAGVRRWEMMAMVCFASDLTLESRGSYQDNPFWSAWWRWLFQGRKGSVFE